MELHLYEKFVLLALNAQKGKFVIDVMSLNNGLAGAILLELSESGKIEIKNKRIVIVDNKLTNNSILNACIKLINKSKKGRKPRFWIYKIGNKSSGFKKIILKDLHHKRIIKFEIKEFFWGLIKVRRYPVLDTKLINEIKTELKATISDNKTPKTDSLLLLSLMASCKLTHILFENKKDHRAANKRIKELTKNIEISEAVSQTLKELQTAILVATTSTFVNSSSG